MSGLAEELAQALNVSPVQSHEDGGAQPAVPAEPQEVEARNAQEVESEAEQGGDEGSTSEAEEFIRTFTQLAESFEVEPEVLYGLEFEFPESTGIPPMTIGDLKNRVETIEADKRANEQAKQELEQERTTTLARLAQVQAPQEPPQLQAMRAELMSMQNTMQNTDWTALRERDPTQAIAYRQELQDTIGQLQQQVGMAEQQYTQAMQMHMQQLKQENMRELVRHVPEFQDEAKWKAAGQKMLEVGEKFDFSPQEIQSVGDQRVIRMLYTLSQLMEKDAAAKKAVEKTLKAPKSLRPGAVRGGSKFDARKFDALKRKAKAPGASKADTMAALRAAAERSGL